MSILPTDTALRPIDDQSALGPVRSIRLAELTPDATLRSGGLDQTHVELLAETEKSTLPPVVVHRHTMRVIDGAHRLCAAALRGDAEIEAVMFDGDEDEAYVLAVKMNISHGLPLSIDDRKAAATRILMTNSDWSDRRIASCTGLARQTVRAIRQSAIGSRSAAGARVGLDGRVRPVSAADGRLLASKLVAERPDASLREIAKEAGVSPSTARDVRLRLAAGRDPIPDKLQPAPIPVTRSEHRGEQVRRTSRTHVARSLTRDERRAAIAVLKNDPSLKFSETGRRLLRWIVECGLEDPDLVDHVVQTVPAHSVDTVVSLAGEYAKAWAHMADKLRERETSERALGS